MLRTILLIAIALCLAQQAGATVKFQRVFVDDYLADHPDRPFVDYVRTTAKCYTCHQGCKNRQNHNAFGGALAKRLDAAADRNDVAKILAAFVEVESLPADAANPAGPTFGQRIADGKLPAGEVEQSQSEPAQ
jgi:hypothetical protein